MNTKTKPKINLRKRKFHYVTITGAIRISYVGKTIQNGYLGIDDRKEKFLSRTPYLFTKKETAESAAASFTGRFQGSSKIHTILLHNADS
jgi:hypothetical protein